MPPPTDNTIEAFQRDIQRLLGRALLRLQQYERLLKAMNAMQDVSGPAHALNTIHSDRVAERSRRTLGALAKELLGFYVFNGQKGIDDEEIPLPAAGGDFVSLRFQVEFSDDEYARFTNDLKDLVELRNNLVHHFMDQHDLLSADGCRGAQDALISACARIDQSHAMLHELAKDMEAGRQLLASYVQTDEFKELLLNGIHPDGEVAWSAAGIVVALRYAAAQTMAIDGWTPLEKAVRWIAAQYPEQVPEKYGCRSWPQVLHESKAFEIRYFEQVGKRLPFYRERLSSRVID